METDKMSNEQLLKLFLDLNDEIDKRKFKATPEKLSEMYSHSAELLNWLWKN